MVQRPPTTRIVLANDLISRNGYEDSDQAPFVSYDQKKHVRRSPSLRWANANNLQLFSCSIDRQDTNTASYFLSQLKFFTTRALQSRDVIDPPIRPLDGSIPRIPVDQHNAIYEPAGLLDFNAVDEESDDDDALWAMQHVTTYWRPHNGDIKILSTTTAENVASLTGCSIYPEPVENRVRLVGGDFHKALDKLQNLEPLLVGRTPLCCVRLFFY